MPRQKNSPTPSRSAAADRAKAASMDNVYKKPGYLFRRMQQIAVAVFMDACKAVDLTPVQYATLIAIRAHPGVDATRLSALIAFDRSTLGSVIERLEAKGFIVRKPSADDKRVKLLYLAPAGDTELRNVEPFVADAQVRMLAPLSASDRKTLLRIMTQLVEQANDMSRAPMRAEDAIEHLRKSG